MRSIWNKVRHIVFVALSLIGGITLGATLVGAVTTISTNIVTEGDLQVDGNSTIGSAVGDSVTANAYFTQLRIGTGSTFGWIGTVGADELGVEGAIEVDGAAYFDSTLQVAGVASTSALKVGDEPGLTTINGLIFGYCTFPDTTGFTASTTKYVDCTTSTTGALATTDRIFVQATSSLNAAFTIQAASSTAANTINLRIRNDDTDGTTVTSTNINSVNFWAVRP